MGTVLMVALYTSAFVLSGQGCTIQFKSHGSSRREDSSYWSGTGYPTQAACEAECAADDLCAAFFYNSADGACKKSYRTESEGAESCTSCYFSHKECGTDCPITYKSVSSYKTCEETYATVNNIDLATCQSNCSSAPRCVSFCHDSSTNRCSFSDTNEAESEEYCPNCSHHKKKCSITDRTTETNIDTTLEQDSPTSTSSTISTTNDANTSPSSDDFDASTQSDVTAASATATDVYNVMLTTSEPSETTALQTLLISAETLVSDSTISTTGPNMTSTAKEETTLLDIQSTSTMSVTQLSVTGADLTTAISTSFEHPTTVESTTNGNGTLSYVSPTSSLPTNDNSSTLCFCKCFYENETTIRERIEIRQKYLKVNKRELSSFKMSRVCAPDPRYSSKVAGSMGIFVFTFIVLLVTVPDIFRSVGCVMRKLNINSYIYKHKTTPDKAP